MLRSFSTVMFSPSPGRRPVGGGPPPLAGEPLGAGSLRGDSDFGGAVDDDSGAGAALSAVAASVEVRAWAGRF
ncbi:MAG TPA: hypothetical protein VHU82_12225 [Vicinamibacterales bacterium]|nr:hypothetical protein [Vicinamibacterales bacterium]